jgi:hypothetical protein
LKWQPTVLAFLLGVLVALTMIRARYFKFNDEFNVASVLSLIITIGIAVGLQYYVNQKGGERRIEKDLLIDYVKESHSVLKEIRSLVRLAHQEGTISVEKQRAIVGTFRNLSNIVHSMKS